MPPKMKNKKRVKSPRQIGQRISGQFCPTEASRSLLKIFGLIIISFPRTLLVEWIHNGENLGSRWVKGKVD